MLQRRRAWLGSCRCALALWRRAASIEILAVCLCLTFPPPCLVITSPNKHTGSRGTRTQAHDQQQQHTPPQYQQHPPAAMHGEAATKAAAGLLLLLAAAAQGFLTPATPSSLKATAVGPATRRGGAPYGFGSSAAAAAGPRPAAFIEVEKSTGGGSGEEDENSHRGGGGRGGGRATVITERAWNASTLGALPTDLEGLSKAVREPVRSSHQSAD